MGGSKIFKTNMELITIFCIFAILGLVLIAGCIESGVSGAEAVVIKISPGGEKISETVIPCSGIHQTSPYIRTLPAKISGNGSFVIIQYPNISTELITRAVIIDNNGKMIKDTVFPAIDKDIFDLIAFENDTVVAISEDGILYSFSSNGDLVSGTSVFELDGEITKSGYTFASAAPAAGEEIVLAGEDKKPGYVQILNISPEEKKVSETRIKIGGMPWIHKVIQTDDGGFLVGGSYSDSASFPHSRPWIAKTDDNGSLLWENKLGSVNDSFIDFYESEDGEYHIIYAAQVTGENGSYRDQYIEAIVDNSGNMVSTANDSILKYPKLISKDGLIFTETISGTDGGKKLHIIKTNAEGETEWDSLCELSESSATSSSIGSGIVRTVDGGYLITGARYYY
ncbi:hypothetical protein [Methanolacinia paynteri]|uniref:hypothetical protein n=1 Tax=Methanolacinia paynteri TaxID=230356 RepID=UPI00064FD365|nr:hypothetical protein [Methanolacinia paynteri]